MGIITISNINSKSLEEMLIKRERGEWNFLLIDVREWNEWGEEYIEGTDYLLPYSNFLYEVRRIHKLKETPIVLYCSTGKRSLRCLNTLKQVGFRQLYNLTKGLQGYSGTILYP